MKKIILDCDPGIDDAMAIAYALNHPELDLLALTTCFGNAHVDVTTKNALDLLELFEARNVPVYAGTNKAFDGSHPRDGAPAIHGENGVGDVALPSSTQKVQKDEAVDYLIRMAAEHPKEITLVAVGTMTNVARAIEADPSFVTNIREIVMMGGAVRHPGNITPLAEANIHADPKAANVVFSSGASIRLVGLDVTMKTLLAKTQYEDWRTASEIGQTLANIVDFYVTAYERNNPGIGGCSLHDPLAIGVVIDPSFVKTVPMDVTVGESGEAYGQTFGEENAESSVHVCLEVDADRFVDHFLRHVLA
ncbi:nucleoside hydrolase [Bacillaceae bacterium SIJ1]|uniref:nucleoside hydrolase n=1 Tax=Litoribacterium kuwaitense TaxID=1398745 RepID=UPI0013EC6C0E|nr:nucleoside hydrolase [Litoribacterium kuwaitense]NGP44816.1 nucleoside hydrolase [Litoribacterium kuwaitense]